MEKFFELQQFDFEAQLDTNLTLESAHATKEKQIFEEQRMPSQSERNNDYDPHGLIDHEVSTGSGGVVSGQQS